MVIRAVHRASESANCYTQGVSALVFSADGILPYEYAVSIVEAIRIASAEGTKAEPRVTLRWRGWAKQWPFLFNNLQDTFEMAELEGSSANERVRLAANELSECRSFQLRW